MPTTADTTGLPDDALGSPAEPVRWRSPRWAWPISLFICLCGIGVASYLTYAHYTDVRNLACSDRGVINCAKVTTSAQSHFLGMPVAVLGLAYFVGMAVLCLPWAWRRPEPIVRYARLGAAVGGVAMVLWLVYAELFIIDAICLYCSIVHGLSLLLFLVIAAATVSGTSRLDVDEYDEYDDFDEDEADDGEDQPGYDEPHRADDPRLTKTD
jgi:uncharacterized membrane protein